MKKYQLGIEPDEIISIIQGMKDEKKQAEANCQQEKSARGNLNTQVRQLETELWEVRKERGDYKGKVDEAGKKAEEAEKIAAAYRTVESDIAKHYRGEEKIRELEGKYTQIKEMLCAGDESIITRLEDTIKDAEAYRLADEAKQYLPSSGRFAGVKEGILALAACVVLTISANNLRDWYQRLFKEDSPENDEIIRPVETYSEMCMGYDIDDSVDFPEDAPTSCSEGTFLESIYNIALPYDLTCSDDIEMADQIENGLASLTKGEESKIVVPRTNMRRRGTVTARHGRNARPASLSTETDSPKFQLGGGGEESSKVKNPAAGSQEQGLGKSQPNKQPSAPPNSGTPPAEKPAGSLPLETLPLPEERNTSNNEGDK